MDKSSLAYPSPILFHLIKLDLLMIGSPLTLRYLGQYAHMFDSSKEKPFMTWSTISWLLKDYGMSQTKEMHANIYYKRISRQWSRAPPMLVASHLHFCNCPHRCKWNPLATLSSHNTSGLST